MQRVGRITREFVAFTWKEALSCVFAVAMFALIFVTARIPLGPFHRYDVILVGAILAQWAMVKSGLESWDELRTITLFHVVGLGLELFKTMPSIGSWAYPEDAWTKLGGVKGRMVVIVSMVMTVMSRPFQPGRRIFRLRN